MLNAELVDIIFSKFVQYQFMILLDLHHTNNFYSSSCKFTPTDYHRDQNGNIRYASSGEALVRTPAFWKHGCLERMCRCQIHETDQPTSIGCVAAHLLDAHRTLEVHENVPFQGETLPFHVSWANGVGVCSVSGDFMHLGSNTRVLTGKGTGSGTSFTKHAKQFQMLCLESFWSYPPHDAFGDAKFDLLSAR